MKTILSALTISALGLSAALVAAPASAADILVAETVMAAPVVSSSYDWTGFYVGVFGGVGSTDTNFSIDLSESCEDCGDVDPLTLDVTGGGTFGGIKVGGDYQFDSFVLGASASLALSGVESSVGLSVPGFFPGDPPLLDASAVSKLTYLGTVEARAGVAMDSWLGYIHGGAAFGHTEQSITGSFDGSEPATIEIGESDKLGFVVGAGFEYALTDSISFATEYSYYDLGEDEIASEDGLFTVNESLTMHAVTAGLNFRF